MKVCPLNFWLLPLVLVLLACEPVKQDHAHSGRAVARGTPVKPGRVVDFPADHGIHSQQGIEWWYLTANLTSNSGDTFGVQWTLFRTLLPGSVESKWWDDNLYFAHFALQHEQTHMAFERFARAGQAKVSSTPFEAVLDDWQLRSLGGDFLPLQLTAKETNYAVSLTLDNSPVTLHGDNGYSQKTQSGHASFYFSYPFLRVTGSLTFAGKDYTVSGHAWYDREWSASLLDTDQVGWDWFSLVDEELKNGLMLFCIRDKNDNYENCAGSLIDAEGVAVSLQHQDISLTVQQTISLGNKTYPRKWRVDLPNREPTIIETITHDSRNQLSISYWEGRIQSTGGFAGKGYGEVTGN
ncbi:ABC transporter [Alteromonas ponticola]|uniref:ABC transporter n=1 Tax=Alteromonas aquimaris TaxID=2998417 RepID=A0ABT3PB11_9ALTE|nr:lipocalin-like domain-containing protein [Alteromonas aquimaris]MCW8109894.1 ABC transporter [Alteromonas aquimaris]